MDPASQPLPATRTRPTARGWGMLFMSMGLVLLGSLLPEPAVVQLGLAGLVIMLLAWPVSARNLSGLTIHRTHPPAAFAGQLFAYTLELVQEKDRTSYAVEVEDTVSGPAERGMDAAHVTGGQPAIRRFETRLLRRGPRHRARAILTSSFPLGLWLSTQELRDTLDMIIYPRPVPPRSLEDAQDSALLDAEEEESNRRDWCGDFHGIRAFQPGDRLKLIHWPATARAGRMMVRLFDQRLPEKYTIVFHSILPGQQSSGPDAFESSLELLSGMLVYCRDHTIPLALTASFDRWRTQQIPNGAFLESALESLAGARRVIDRDPGPLLHALSTAEPGSRIFLISDIPVKEWEHLIPDLPFAITCLGINELRIKRPGIMMNSASLP